MCKRVFDLKDAHEGDSRDRTGSTEAIQLWSAVNDRDQYRDSEYYSVNLCLVPMGTFAKY